MGWFQVTEEYLEHLLLLDRKIAYITTDETAKGSQCRRDVEPVLEKLRVKAITKVYLKGLEWRGSISLRCDSGRASLVMNSTQKVTHFCHKGWQYTQMAKKPVEGVAWRASGCRQWTGMGQKMYCHTHGKGGVYVFLKTQF
jgi:hypothetical protein